MKIKRFNENIEVKEVKHIDPKEVCPECGAIAVHLMDHSAFDVPDKFIEDGEDGMNFDDYFHGTTKCDNCNHRDIVEGYVEWNNPTKLDKRLEYIEMYRKGINPVDVKKFNL